MQLQRARRKRAKATAAAESKHQEQKQEQEPFKKGFLMAPTKVGSTRMPAQWHLLDAVLPAPPGEHAPKLSNNVAALTMLVRLRPILSPLYQSTRAS